MSLINKYCELLDNLETRAYWARGWTKVGYAVLVYLMYAVPLFAMVGVAVGAYYSGGAF